MNLKDLKKSLIYIALMIALHNIVNLSLKDEKRKEAFNRNIPEISEELQKAITEKNLKDGLKFGFIPGLFEKYKHIPKFSEMFVDFFNRKNNHILVFLDYEDRKLLLYVRKIFVMYGFTPESLEDYVRRKNFKLYKELQMIKISAETLKALDPNGIYIRNLSNKNKKYETIKSFIKKAPKPVILR